MVQKAKSYIDDVLTETKLIRWPERKQAILLTIYVIGASLIVGLIVSGFDFIFKELLKFILN